MRELARELLSGEQAWVVGGALRDELLGRPVVDLDVVCSEPERAARAYARREGRGVFPLSEEHGGWRVALGDGRTVDFLPLQGGSIEADLGTRDFALNAIAEPLAGGEPIDPFDGRGDVERRAIRAVSPGIFERDPLRLLRAVRLEDELGFRIDRATERLLREQAALVARPAGERILDELGRLSADGYERLGELGLLEPLGGKISPRLRSFDSPGYRLAVTFGDSLRRLPVSGELRRLVRTLLRSEAPADGSPRAIHRFRRATEPWALEVLAYLGADEHADVVRDSRAHEPAEPLLRGDELGIEPGPEVGRLLELVAEERAAGTISTREEALALVNRSLG